MIFFQNPHPSNVHLLKKRNKQRIVKNERIAFINMLTIYIDADKEVKLKQIENKIMMIDWHILTDNSCFIKTNVD